MNEDGYDNQTEDMLATDLDTFVEKAPPSFVCGVCQIPITATVWQSCRVCDSVDFDVGCVKEGRKLHHRTHPGHGFIQVSSNSDKAEEEEEKQAAVAKLATSLEEEGTSGARRRDSPRAIVSTPRKSTSKPTSQHSRAPERSLLDLSAKDPLTEAIAKGISRSRLQTASSTSEFHTVETFASKWLFTIHCYLRSWSEQNSSPTHAINGFHILVAFDANAQFHGFTRQSYPTEVDGEECFAVLESQEKRNHRFTNPFEAAGAARRLNRRSIEIWKEFRDRAGGDGVIGGWNMGTMGVSNLQEMAKLLEMAR
ncbi:uncharacterized protein SEPMUDRAFT_121709 [Sphaerulina musiva SO2202]|uniref:Uncharacterized protein n=1 Tax=Sphaerulina musiva (strain SO2202) TaxID=692275 RepID=M3CX18_SPHMS|nr:uncharacterized protein SEPMUDRAFT_121709 [Sphaerulina musiva SO2202]EMF08221.1 hypothetical protein SEPMUDRAFT_121709 [Sphaerulina musiva SO2202]